MGRTAWACPCVQSRPLMDVGQRSLRSIYLRKLQYGDNTSGIVYFEKPCIESIAAFTTTKWRPSIRLEDDRPKVYTDAIFTICCSSYSTKPELLRGILTTFLFPQVKSPSHLLKGASEGSSQSDAAYVKRLHLLERHIRKNKLRQAFSEQISGVDTTTEEDSTGDAGIEISSSKEARQLAAFLFWNVRPNSDRYLVTFLIEIALHFMMEISLQFC